MTNARRSPLKHISIADDSYKSKFADELYYDMENPTLRVPFAVDKSQYIQKSTITP
jgi:hypothetical protein